MSEDTGRQVPYHRSGGGSSGVGLLMAALAMSATMAPGGPIEIRRRPGDGEPWRDLGKPETVNTGQRAEKDAAALAKAQAKRDRRAAKRIAAASSNAAVSRPRDGGTEQAPADPRSA